MLQNKLCHSSCYLGSIFCNGCYIAKPKCSSTKNLVRLENMFEINIATSYCSVILRLLLAAVPSAKHVIKRRPCEPFVQKPNSCFPGRQGKISRSSFAELHFGPTPGANDRAARFLSCNMSWHKAQTVDAIDSKHVSKRDGSCLLRALESSPRPLLR